MKRNNITQNRSAQVGIGTLIIFIAMVLVAAVAAAVLIQTSGVLQQKAQTTGKEATKEVSSNIDIDSIEGWRGGLNSSTSKNDSFSDEIYRLDMRCSLKVGSEPVDMNQVVITITDGTTTNDLRYIYGELNATDGDDAPRIGGDVNNISTYYRLEVRDGVDDGEETLCYFMKACPDAHLSGNVIYSETGTSDNNRIGNTSSSTYFGRCDKFYIIEEIRDEDKSYTGANPVMNTGDLVKVVILVGPNDLDTDISSAWTRDPANNETLGESSLSIMPRTTVAIGMIPEGGAGTMVDFATPSSFGTHASVDLYP